MKIGIIGTGVLTTSVVKAIIGKYEKGVDIFLSPRNAERSAMLAGMYENATVMPSNQAVLDAADIIMLAVLPKDAEAIIEDLKFSPGHEVISFVAGPTLAELTRWIGGTKTLTRVIPLTFIENRVGPIAVFPGTKMVRDLFQGLGDVIVPDDEESFFLLQNLTAILGSFFHLVDDIVQWAETHGGNRRTIAPFVFSLFGALADQGIRADPGAISTLWEEMTPGGLNERTMKSIQKDGGFALWTKALDMLQRQKK